MARILAYTSPATGHVFPLVPGLLALRERGHDVHVRIGPSTSTRCATPASHAEPLDPRIAAVPIDDYEAKRRTRPAPQGPARPARARAARARGPRARDRRATSPTCCCVDTNAYGAAVAAEASGLPWAIASSPRCCRSPARASRPTASG